MRGQACKMRAGRMAGVRSQLGEPEAWNAAESGKKSKEDENARFWGGKCGFPEKKCKKGGKQRCAKRRVTVQKWRVNGSKMAGNGGNDSGGWRESGNDSGRMAGNGENPGGKWRESWREDRVRSNAWAGCGIRTARGQVSRAVPRYSSPSWPRFSTDRNHRAAPWADSLRRTRLKWGEKVRTLAGTRSPSRKLTRKPRHKSPRYG